VNSAPLAVFDSGLGGLSIAREIRRLLPGEDLVYFADTAFCPYGGRPNAEIRDRSSLIARELSALGAKALVVACNTASGAALETLRAELPIPVIGTEPAVKPAVALTRNGRVGVMATTATLRSERFARLLRDYAGDAEIVAEACPGLADLVEQGHTEGPAVEARLRELLAPLRSAGVDTLVLGCTHYPFVAGAVGRVMGPEVRLVETGEAIARQTAAVLESSGQLAAGSEGNFRLLTTGAADAVSAVATRLWGSTVQAEAASVGAGGQGRSSGAPPSAGSSR
jgi:glutamate racemase